MIEVRKIAEKYANGGFELLMKKLDTKLPGSLINHFEEELNSLRK